MIKFTNVSWRNFLSTGNVPTSVRLDEHYNTLIIGENGSGKSTILDAITFGLFGKPFRKINKPVLCNSINDSDCLVELEFEIGTKQYRIERGIKPAIFNIYVDGDKLDVPTSNKDFQGYLESQILKLNYKTFTQVVILGSSTFVPFMQLTTGARREIIEDLLDIQIFTVMNAKLKEKIAQHKLDHQETITAISIKEQYVRSQNDTISKIKTNNDIESDKLELQLDSYQKELDQLNAEFSDISAQMAEIDANVDYVNQQKNGLEFLETEKLINKFDNKITSIRKQIQFFENNNTCPTCEQGLDDHFKTHSIEEKGSNLSQIEEGRALLEKKKDRINRKIARAEDLKKIYAKLTGKKISVENKILAIDQIMTNINESIHNIKKKENTDIIQAEIDKTMKELEELNQTKSDLADQAEIHKIVGGLLKDSGIKTLIVKQYLPIINQLINKYLTQMDFFINFTLDENFSETIKSRHRDEFQYDSFSEGEKKRIDLSLLMTWRDVARLKNSVNTNLLILDEIFDSSLDDAGTQEFLKILYSLDQDQNTFVISHKSDILLDKFKHNIKFEKVKGFSKIV